MFRTLLFGFLTGISLAVQAAVVFQDLGTGAPPASLGGIRMQAFSAAAQAAIADDTQVTTIPGSPFGVLTLNLPACKATVPATWNGWSHGYTGPVFQTFGGSPCSPPALASPDTRILTLPAGTKAFYFYANQGDDASIQTITATSDTGTTSGPISIPAVVDTANGYGFFSNAGENIATITITTSDPSGFGFGEFGIGLPPLPIPALSDWAKLALITLCLLSGAIALRRRRQR